MSDKTDDSDDESDDSTRPVHHHSTAKTRPPTLIAKPAEKQERSESRNSTSHELHISDDARESDYTVDHGKISALKRKNAEEHVPNKSSKTRKLHATCVADKNDSVHNDDHGERPLRSLRRRTKEKTPSLTMVSNNVEEPSLGPRRNRDTPAFERPGAVCNHEVVTLGRNGAPVRRAARQSPAASADTKKTSTPWTSQEKDLVKTLMLEVIQEQEVNLTEHKWNVVSERLAQRYGITRTHTAVKNYWNRTGREKTGIDERRNPNPEKLTTGVQDPEQRRKARQDASKFGSSGRNRKKGKGSDGESES